MSDAETKLKSFVEFCLQKLDSAEAELTDEDPEDNYGEQCDFMTGLSRNLKTVGAAASADLRVTWFYLICGNLQQPLSII